jgi:hypothetical protein
MAARLAVPVSHKDVPVPVTASIVPSGLNATASTLS